MPHDRRGRAALTGGSRTRRAAAEPGRCRTAAEPPPKRQEPQNRQEPPTTPNRHTEPPYRKPPFPRIRPWKRSPKKQRSSKKYFPELTPEQRAQFAALEELYAAWNARINVISRRISTSFLRHVLHSLAIAKVCRFDAGARVLDVGCGGGFPSIPLAILFPEAHFTAADSIRKKITVVEGSRRAWGCGTSRRSACGSRRFRRATTMSSRGPSRRCRSSSAGSGSCSNGGRLGSLPNGILYLKGGDLAEELARTRLQWRLYEIQDFFTEPFFETKKVVYTPIKIGGRRPQKAPAACLTGRKTALPPRKKTRPQPPVADGLSVLRSPNRKKGSTARLPGRPHTHRCGINPPNSGLYGRRGCAAPRYAAHSRLYHIRRHIASSHRRRDRSAHNR